MYDNRHQMKPHLLPLGSVPCIALAALFFSTTASAGTIYVDNAGSIYQYAGDGSSALPNVFSGSAVHQDIGLALNTANTLFAATETGIYSYSTSGVPTLFAAVDAVGIAISPSGNIYTGVNLVGGEEDLDEFTPTSGSPTETRIKTNTSVDSLAFDSSGNLYEADDSGILYKYTNGAGTPTALTSSLPGYNFYGLAIDNSGDVFVSYQSGSGGGIDEFSAAGVLSPFVTFLGTSIATDILPMGLTYDTQTSELYMTFLNAGNAALSGVYGYTPAGGQSTLASGTSLSSATGIAYAAPEPGTLVLMIAGLFSVTLLARRRRVRA
jgi:hypothetical protein